MTNLGILVSASALSILLLGCSAQHLEYQSNEFLEGPGIFAEALADSKDSAKPEADDPTGSPLDGAGQVQNSETASIDEENRRLLSEFQSYLKSKNLSKESQQYEEFRQWLMWRYENKPVSAQ